MTEPPREESPDAWTGAGASEDRFQQHPDNPEHSLTTEIAQDRLARRPMRPDELPHVRALFWRHAAQGTRLPAERGVILIDGDLS